MTIININRKTGLAAEGAPVGGDIIAEAFKPGTGPADTYFVIGAEVAEQRERQRAISPNAQRAVETNSGGLF
jgi:penicillin-binding protein 1A